MFWTIVFAIIVGYLMIKFLGWLIVQKFSDPIGTATRISVAALKKAQGKPLTWWERNVLLK